MVMNILQVVEIVKGINMSKCKNTKCNKCSSSSSNNNNNLYKDDWKVLSFNYKGFMRISKVALTLLVFVISSFQWGYTGDVLWQCVWSLSLLKVVELSDE